MVRGSGAGVGETTSIEIGGFEKPHNYGDGGRSSLKECHLKGGAHKHLNPW